MLAKKAPVPMAERRRRISEGHKRRNEPVQPVPTSALIERPLYVRAPSRPPVPPRPELEVDLAKGLKALPLPSAPKLGLDATATGSWKGSCKAVDAATGRACKLPAHPGEVHRSERGPFVRVAAPGATSFPLRQALEHAALHQADVVEGPSARPPAALAKRQSRERLKSEVRRRARRGDTESPVATTTPTPEAA